MPPPGGVNVEPLGELLIRLLPDGFCTLLAPALALPALLPTVPAAPVVTPQVEDSQAEPDCRTAALRCASAAVLLNASTMATPIAARFIYDFPHLPRMQDLPRMQE